MNNLKNTLYYQKTKVGQEIQARSFNFFPQNNQHVNKYQD